MGLRAGLDWRGKSHPTGIRSPDRPARRQSLYRLSYPAHNAIWKPEKSGRYDDSLWVRRSEIRIPEDSFFFCFQNHPERLWGPPRTLYNGYSNSFLKQGGRGVKQTTHFHLAPKERIYTVLSLFSLSAFLLTVIVLRVLFPSYVYLFILFVFVVLCVYCCSYFRCRTAS